MLTFLGGTNYGTALQAYALCEFLRTLGHDAEVIRYYDNHLVHQGQRTIKSVNLTKILNKLEDIILNFFNRKRIERRKRVFSDFRIRAIPHTNQYYNAETIQRTLGKYDCYICGSDQIWTPWNGGFDPVYWLEFAPNDYLKISYAPSLANTNYSVEAKNALRNICEGFDNISVREAIGKEFLEGLGVKNVEKVLDPTLLFPDGWWLKHFLTAGGGQDQIDLPEDYIFAYFLGANRKHRRLVKQFAKIVDLPIVTFPFQDQITVEDYFFGDVRMDAEPPEAFLSCIKNARYIFTDSFHVSVFSSIFEKEFWAFRKFSNQDRASQNSRLYEFLSVIGYEQRLLDDSISAKDIRKYEPIDYQRVRSKIENERVNSIRYLQEALGKRK